MAALAEGRFAFINVWRSIADDGPVRQKPLAVCDEASVDDEDRFLCAAIENRTRTASAQLCHSSLSRVTLWWQTS